MDYYNQTSIDEHSRIITILIESGVAFALGRLGSNELAGIEEFRRHPPLVSDKFSKQVSNTLYVNTGVFPNTPHGIAAWANVYLERMSQLDYVSILAVSFKQERLQHIPELANIPKIIPRALEPYYTGPGNLPWTIALRNRKVLVMSPFTESIKQQYQKRTKIWSGAEYPMLPDFELLTIKIPLSKALRKNQYDSWSEALKSMEDQMRGTDFDVCLIGGGSFSVPLAVFAKQMGKVGIHIGGSLQILFGIKGRRWDAHPIIPRFYNDSWTRPNVNELPEPGKEHLVEGGCYW